MRRIEGRVHRDAGEARRREAQRGGGAGNVTVETCAHLPDQAAAIGVFAAALHDDFAAAADAGARFWAAESGDDVDSAVARIDADVVEGGLEVRVADLLELRRAHLARALENAESDGVELADSWWDWINWRDIGYRTADGVPKMPSFVPDRNAGIWKPVLLHASGDATLGPASVSTELPLPLYHRGGTAR